MSVDENNTQAEKLYELAAFDFDLSELFARKIRKELYENKKTFSDANFFQQYYDKMIAHRGEISSRVYSEYDFGKNEEFLQKEHDSIKVEINKLADFYKTCKPPKKKRKSKNSQ